MYLDEATRKRDRMSSHSRNNSTHKTTRHSRRKHKASFAIKDIILDPGDEDLYGDGDFDSYEDTKIEMRNAGHNLVSFTFRNYFLCATLP